MLADLYTPAGIYLRVRDKFRDTILLESTDYHAGENNYSFICINAIGGIEISTPTELEYKLPGAKPEKLSISRQSKVPELLWEFFNRFEIEKTDDKSASFAAGMYGYMTYDSIELMESIDFKSKEVNNLYIPLVRYRLYQYVIAIDHFKDELHLCEIKIEGLGSERDLLESLIRGKDVPVFPFRSKNNESSNMTDDDYKQMVSKGIRSCKRGDVFQVVLSRRFEQSFTGDEFNVYRALRNINPSPYLFFFDYGDYKLMGSSPESQLVIRNGEAMVHPIAGTVKRTGDEKADKFAAERLLSDAKENAEHVMLVDLARNDLGTVCENVEVTRYREIQYFSHVIHLVSEVKATLESTANPFVLLSKSFPAGTLSGAPKYRAMELIDEYEPTKRSWYGGTVGFVGFNGNCNQAILIRSFLSKGNKLVYQAGAGVVASSVPENELQEVNNKLAALKKAIHEAQEIC